MAERGSLSRLGLVLVTMLLIVAGATGCGGDEVPTAETCGDFTELSATDQTALAEDMLSRFNPIDGSATAFASQLDKACLGNESSELATIAATVTIAETQGMSDYDDPLP